MSRDYKTRKPSTTKPEKSGSAFLGGFVGYALGLASAIAIWLYFNFGQSPFLSNQKTVATTEKSQSQPTQEASKIPPHPILEETVSLVEEKPKFDFYKILPGIEEPEIDYGARQATEKPKQPQAAAKAPEAVSKPIEIVPQPMPSRPVTLPPPIETAVSPPRTVPIEPKSQPQLQQPVPPQVKNPPSPAKEKIFLQAGAFRRTDDAENMKARLALLGIVASIQSIDLAEKGILYRVRIGPFNSKTDSDQASASLRENGIETQFVRIQ